MLCLYFDNKGYIMKAYRESKLIKTRKRDLKNDIIIIRKTLSKRKGVIL